MMMRNLFVVLVMLLSLRGAAQQERRGREERQEHRRHHRHRHEPQGPQPRAGMLWSGILDPSRAIDWTHAGVQIRSSTQVGCQWVGQYPDCVNGLPTNRTQCSLTGKSYAVNNVIQPSGLQDGTDAWNISDALKTCGAITSAAGYTGSGVYVQLAAGTFWIAGGVQFGDPQNAYGFNVNVNSVTLKGMGPDQTYLRSLTSGIGTNCAAINAICIAGNAETAASRYYPYAGTCQWTGGYAQGTTQLTFTNCFTGNSANPTGMPQVGWHIILDQRNDDIGLTQCTSSGSVATCTVSLTALPSTFQVGACVGIGQINNQAGMSSATNPSFSVQPYSPPSTPFNVPCNQITATSGNTFSYNLPFGANLPTVGPCYTPSSTPVGNYVANSNSNVATGMLVTICGWATVDTHSLYVTGVPCVTMAGTCAWGQVSGGLTIGRFCPDTSGYPTGGFTPANPGRGAINCQPNEISNRSQTQVVTVTAVTPSGCATAAPPTCTITIDTPIYATNWRTEQSPGVWWFTQSPMGTTGATCCFQHDDGIESLTVDAMRDGGGTGNSSVAISKCYNCWIRNVRALAGSRNSFWFQNADAHVTVRDSYMWGTKGGASSSYGVELYGTTADFLMENNIVMNAPSAYMNGGTWGTVSSYTYATDDGNPSAQYMYGSISLNHDLNGNNLYEGNDSNAAGADDIHGTITGVITEFRSRERGQQVFPFKQTSLAPYTLNSRNRGLNFVGGVLGTAGAQSTYQTASTPTIPGFAVGAQGGNVWAIGTTSQSGSTISQDPWQLPSIMRWGNYDVITGAVRWCGTGTESGCTPCMSGTGTACSEMAASQPPFLVASPVPASQTLPASFYLSAQPAWFVTPWGTPPWPPIGPEITTGTAPDTEPCPMWPSPCTGGHSYSIPSQLAYDNAALDTQFLVPQIINANGASWSGGIATLTGTFTMPVGGTFQMTGMTPAGYNGLYRVYATDGPIGDFVVGNIPSNPSFATCPSGYTCSSPGAGITLPPGSPAPSGGSYYMMIAISRLNIAVDGTTGETLRSGLARQSVATTCTAPSPSGNCAIIVPQPCNAATVSGLTTTCNASGNSLGGGHASTYYNVYMGWQLLFNGTTWLPNTVLCKQNAAPIPYGTPPSGNNSGGGVGNQYIQRDPIIMPGDANCVQPPLTSTATAGTIQYLMASKSGGSMPDPGSPGTGGTINFPVIKVFNADNYYGSAVPPVTPTTPAQGITGHGQITGQGKIT